jgi:hypothetical protein
MLCLTFTLAVITGDPSKLPGAVKQLIDFMKDIQFKGPHQPYDPSNYNPQLCHAYGGFEGGGNLGGCCFDLLIIINGCN